MKNKTGLLLLMLLIFINNSFSQQSNHIVPEATAVEFTLPFKDIPNLKKAFIDASPIDRKDSIPVGKLGIDGGNKAKILKLAQEIADDKYDPFDSFLIAYKGKLLFESYYRKGRINLPHFQASATKAYTSMALGRAIQLGYLTMDDLDKPVFSFFKGLDPTKFVEGAEKITLDKALTMRGGFGISKEQRESFKKTPAVLKGQNQVQTLLEHSAPITPVSQNFLYGNFNPSLVMQVIEAAVPGTAKDFIKKELLDKMGITNYTWGTDINGLPRSGSRSNMTSRDMIKWGTLAMNKGQWNSEQLIPEAFIAKATSKILYTGDDDVYGGGKDVSNQGYGYYWWNADLKVGNKSYFSTSAQGGGGQYIILIKALDLMVVVTSHENDNSTLQIVAERILPAFIHNAIPTINEKSDASTSSMESLYFGQKPPGLTPEIFVPKKSVFGDWKIGNKDSLDIQEFYFTYSGNDPFQPAVVVYRQEGNYYKTNRYTFHTRSTENSNILYSRHNYIERTNSGWSKLKSLGPMFDRKDWGIMVLSVSNKGTIVFDDYKSNDVIRISRIINGKREAPKLLGKEINSGKWTAHPYIAPDESFLLWGSEREDGYGKSDNYISFKQQDGSWGPAINMGDKINSELVENGASLTPDGKYLLFGRSEEKVSEDGSTYWESKKYWVDAKIIKELRPKK